MSLVSYEPVAILEIGNLLVRKIIPIANTNSLPYHDALESSRAVEHFHESRRKRTHVRPQPRSSGADRLRKKPLGHHQTEGISAAPRPEGTGAAGGESRSPTPRQCITACEFLYSVLDLFKKQDCPQTTADTGCSMPIV